MTRSIEMTNRCNFQDEDYELTYYADHEGKPTSTQFGDPRIVPPGASTQPTVVVPHGKDFWVHVRCVENPDAPKEPVPQVSIVSAPDRVD